MVYSRATTSAMAERVVVFLGVLGVVLGVEEEGILAVGTKVVSWCFESVRGRSKRYLLTSSEDFKGVDGSVRKIEILKNPAQLASLMSNLWISLSLVRLNHMTRFSRVRGHVLKY